MSLSISRQNNLTPTTPYQMWGFFCLSSTLMGIGIQEHLMKRRNQSVVNALSVLALGSVLIAGCSTHRANKSFYSGVEKYDKGDYQGAISDFSMAIEIEPQFAAAYSNRGLSKAELKDYQGSISDYNKALELDSQFVAALFNRASSRLDTGDYKGSISDYTNALEINPQNSDAYSHRCNAKNQLQDYQGAVDDCAKSIAIDPKNADAYSNLGRAKNALKDHQGAVADYNKAIDLDPQKGLYYSNRAIANYDLTGDLESACKDIKKAASLGMEYRVNYLNSEEGKWCREM